jgi:hypothetical protein
MNIIVWVSLLEEWTMAASIFGIPWTLFLLLTVTVVATVRIKVLDM